MLAFYEIGLVALMLGVTFYGVLVAMTIIKRGKEREWIWKVANYDIATNRMWFIVDYKT